MYQLNFNHPCHTHFIGIGGISMSGLAEILLRQQFTISGSDARESELTKHLEQLGAVIQIGQCAANITNSIDLVVYTAAIHEDNPEYMAAKASGKPMLSRAELLGQIMKNYNHALAIAGTHGKTTTTSMVSQILLEGELDPTISVGGILDAIGGNIRIGGPGVFVTEACEYTDSFLSFFPTIGVILNITKDHMDYFKDLEHIRTSFHKFAGRIPDNGVLVISSGIEKYQEITAGVKCRIVTCGITPESDYQAADIRYDSLGRAIFTLVFQGNALGDIHLLVPGEHNVMNALAAAAAAAEMGVPFTEIQKGLGAFSGTNRRFERKGECNGFTIIDDYAHHPEEIEATIKAARNVPHKKLWVVFQPHTYTRTKAFLDEFIDTLSKADEVILADIYAARETDTLGMHSTQIQEGIEKNGTPAHYFSSFDEIKAFILQQCKQGELLITMGAGDIVNVGESILDR